MKILKTQDLCSDDYFTKKEKTAGKRRKIDKSKETLSEFLAKMEMQITEERMYGLM